MSNSDIGYAILVLAIALICLYGMVMLLEKRIRKLEDIHHRMLP